MIEVRPKAAPQAAGGGQVAGGLNIPAGVPQSARQSPQAFQQYMQNNPQMMRELLTLNPAYAQQMSQEQTAQREQNALLRQIEEDPFNPELQRKLEEQIRLKNVQDNMENAMEYTPESFGRVIMLYIPMTVNKIPLKAFVDSGAQSTIMSVGTP
jgi:DNA damage-inducible protein 1